MSKRNADGSVRENLWEQFFDALEEYKFGRCKKMMLRMKEEDGIEMKRIGKNVLTYCIYHQCHVDFVKKVYNKWPMLINVVDNFGSYGIHYAARGDNMDVFNFMMSVSSNEMLKKRDWMNYLPLERVWFDADDKVGEVIKRRDILQRKGFDDEIWTVKNDDISTFKYLEYLLKVLDNKYGGDVYVFRYRRCLLNLYMMAYRGEDFEEESSLLKKFMHRCLENRVNFFGLGLDIGSDTFLNIMRMSEVMKKRSDIATADKNGNFPLHLLCFAGKIF